MKLNKTRKEMLENDENLEWCKPYVTADEKIHFVINEGRLDGILDHESNRHIWKKEELEKFDVEKLLEEATELPCKECPFFYECDAMND
jgi:hypothetical protein